MYTAIKINDTNYKFKTGDIATEINGLNKINIFVGQNNSGKSRFLRSIFSGKIDFKYKDFDLLLLNKYLDKIIDLCTENARHTSDFNGIKITAQSLKKDYLTSNSDIDKLKNGFQSINLEVDGFFAGGMRYQHKIDFGTIYRENIKPLIVDGFFDVEIKKYKKVYIPMLRGLKNPLPKEFKKDIYKERTVYDYFLNVKKEELDFSKLEHHYSEFDKGEIEIFTGLTLYEDVKRMLLGTNEKRENIREFEKFLSRNFFEDNQVTLTPHIDDDVLYVKIKENGKDIPIYDLGDGIQSIIIHTFPLFKYKDENLCLFMEEPEIGIHPGMQRILLNTLANGIKEQKGEHQIYFTTHSNHFLDIALDKEIDERISIYQFKELNSQNEKCITNISQNKEILDLLGVRNSSVFLSNCII